MAYPRGRLRRRRLTEVRTGRLIVKGKDGHLALALVRLEEEPMSSQYLCQIDIYETEGTFSTS